VSGYAPLTLSFLTTASSVSKSEECPTGVPLPVVVGFPVSLQNAVGVSGVPVQRFTVAMAAIPEDNGAGDSDQDESYVTRCPCRNNQDSSGFMIQCEKCQVWEHGDCVGISQDNEPDYYFCEVCSPDLPHHVANAELRERVAIQGRPARARNVRAGAAAGDRPRGKPGPKPGSKRKRPPAKSKGRDGDDVNGALAANEGAANGVKRARKPDVLGSPQQNGIAHSDSAGMNGNVDDANLSREDRKLKKLAEMLERRDIEEKTRTNKKPKEEETTPFLSPLPVIRIRKPSVVPASADTALAQSSSAAGTAATAPIFAPDVPERVRLRALKQLGPMYFGRSHWLRTGLMQIQHAAAHKGFEPLEETTFPLPKRVCLAYQMHVAGTAPHPRTPQPLGQLVVPFAHARRDMQLRDDIRHRPADASRDDSPRVEPVARSNSDVPLNTVAAPSASASPLQQPMDEDTVDAVGTGSVDGGSVAVPEASPVVPTAMEQIVESAQDAIAEPSPSPSPVALDSASVLTATVTVQTVVVAAAVSGAQPAPMDIAVPMDTVVTDSVDATPLQSGASPVQAVSIPVSAAVAESASSHGERELEPAATTPAVVPLVIYRCTRLLGSRLKLTDIWCVVQAADPSAVETVTLAQATESAPSSSVSEAAPAEVDAEPTASSSSAELAEVTQSTSHLNDGDNHQPMDSSPIGSDPKVDLIRTLAETPSATVS